MIRIAGCVLLNHKRVVIALTSIYGIGFFRSRIICNELGIADNKKVSSLTDEDLKKMRQALLNFEIEGDLRRSIFLRIKRLKDIKCYRGIRHHLGLPVHGQRTRTNAKTRRKFKSI